MHLGLDSVVTMKGLIHRRDTMDTEIPDPDAFQIFVFIAAAQLW